jgi:hypothetical protein
MASATLVTILPETLDQSTMSSVPNSSTSATGSDKRPAIRVLAGRLRLTSYRPFPILLDASDPLVVSFFTSHHSARAVGSLTDIVVGLCTARVRDARRPHHHLCQRPESSLSRRLSTCEPDLFAPLSGSSFDWGPAIEGERGYSVGLSDQRTAFCVCNGNVVVMFISCCRP